MPETATHIPPFLSSVEGNSARYLSFARTPQYSEFIQADDTEKESKMKSLLSSSYIELQLAGLRYIVTNNKTDLLLRYRIASAVGDEQLMTVTHPMFQLLLRILGYEITGDINNILINQRALL